MVAKPLLPRQPALQALLTVVAAALAVSASASENPPPHGSLTRIEVATPDAAVVAVSPNGRNVYTAGGRSDRMHVYRRTPVTGKVALLQGTAGCLARTDARCGRGGAINGPTALAATGRAVLLASWTGRQHVALYRRSPTGALRLASCLGEPTEFARCTPGGRRTTGALAVSPDGRFGYVTAREGPKKVTIFAIESGGRTLRDVGCIGRNGSRDCTSVRTRRFTPTALAISPDGRNLYVTSSTLTERGVVFAFARDRTTGLVTPLTGDADCVAATVPGCRALAPISFRGADEGDPGGAIAISRDGRAVVVGGWPAASYGKGMVITLARDPTTGALSAGGCAGGGPTCTPGVGLSAVQAVAFAPDARTVYAATFHGVVSLRRTAQTLTAFARTAIGKTTGLAVSGDGRSLYAAAGRLVVFRVHR